MRTDEEYRQILGLWEQGFKKKRIAIMTKIPRATVRECIERYKTIAGLEAVRLERPTASLTLRLLKRELAGLESHISESYAYLLGLYLGDGYINKEPRTYKLRIFLTTEYPNIINSCIQSIEVIVPNNKVGMFQGQGNYVEVYCHNNFWPEFFPQFGPGMKHTRTIALQHWQTSITRQHPIEFLKGLFHSDGCRPLNTVNGKNYPRYEFKNTSNDIRRFFSDTCDFLGLHWTTASRGSVIQIARRPDVAFLDQHIGPKS